MKKLVKEDFRVERYKIHLKGLVIYDKSQSRPLLPIDCPVCDKPMQYHDKRALTELGLCSECKLWWAEEAYMVKSPDFDASLDKFIIYANKQRQFHKEQEILYEERKKEILENE